LIQPVGQIDRQLIVEEKANIDQVVATLGLKEMTQSTLIRKLCNYSQQNRTRKAIFEFDKLIRSIYTLRYLCDRQLQCNVHGSQNRIEAYHQLRSATAQVGGKKQLSGKTDRVGGSSRRHCERSWDYRHSKERDCVFRKLNALAQVCR